MSPNLDEMPDQVGHDCLVITGLTGNLLLVKCSSNVNSACNCTTYHWVVTDAEEYHNLNVCWNRRQTEGNQTCLQSTKSLKQMRKNCRGAKEEKPEGLN